MKDLRLLSKALPLGPGENSYYAAPYRMGIQLRAEGDKPFSRRFRDSCSMAMFGAVKEGSALLVTWTDPYTEVQVDYSLQPAPQLRMGLAMRRAAQSVRLQPLGRGGYVEIAKAYRDGGARAGLAEDAGRENAREPPGRGALRRGRFQALRLYAPGSEHSLAQAGPVGRATELHLRGVRRPGRALEPRPGHRPRDAGA